jgi:hypothetical protein
MYHVRKDNTVNYKSNFYTVPMGTYQGTGTHVIVKEKEGILEIYSLDDVPICSHPLSLLKGQIVSNTNHKRDTSKSLDEMMQQVANCFTMPDLAMGHLLKIKRKLPRYTRDHLQVILKSLAGVDKETADKTLDFCLKNNVLNGHEWEQVLQVFKHDATNSNLENEVKLLDENNLEKANQTPQTSNIEDYEDIINPVCRQGRQ